MSDADGDINGVEAGGSGWAAMRRTGGDGLEDRTAIGLIVLTTDLAIEPEFYAFLPRDRVSIHANRIPKRRVVSVETAREMEADSDEDRGPDPARRPPQSHRLRLRLLHHDDRGGQGGHAPSRDAARDRRDRRDHGESDWP